MVWVVNLVILGIICVIASVAKQSKEIATSSAAKAGTSRNDGEVKFWRLNFRGRFNLLFWGVFLIEAALFSYFTYRQYFLWLDNEPAKFLLPPYADINYFIFYAFTRFWLPQLVSGLVGGLGFWGAKLMNYKYGGRFFQPEEPYFLLIGTFLTGHPGWLVYWALIFAIALILVGTSRNRTSLYYIWLPLAALVIALDPLLKMEWGWYSTLFL